MIARVNTLVAYWVGQARTAQQDALRDMQALDAAVAQHMAHGAMAGNDPLTDSLLDQADACAAEGAQPHSTAGAWLTTQQLIALADTQADDFWLDWLMPATLTAAVLAYAAHVLGWI